ncbi:MAG: hypothetical protein WCJ70_03370 [bacterium]
MDSSPSHMHGRSNAQYPNLAVGKSLHYFHFSTHAVTSTIKLLSLPGVGASEMLGLT